MNRPPGKAPRATVAKLAERAKSRIRKREAVKSPPAKTRVHKREPVPLEGRAAYSPIEFARLIGRSRVTVWRYVRDRRVQTVDVLGRPMIPASELKRLGLVSE